nr:MAG TPA: hypothetical protein [Caudoviricetes sp.]
MNKHLLQRHFRVLFFYLKKAKLHRCNRKEAEWK